MAGATVFGLAESLAAFETARTLVGGKLMQGVLEETAEKVAESSREKISRYQGASLDTIKPSARITPTKASVYQNKRKVTGLRGDFGSLQMRKGLVPALEENSEPFVQGLEKMIGEVALITGL